MISEVKKLRIQLGLTQVEFAKITGISQSLCSQYETGYVRPTLDAALKLKALADKRNKKFNIHKV
jgi:predicted transcriptional regulator